jgi:hypothetical protein
MDDFLEFVVVIVLIFGMLGGGIMTIGHFYGKYQCANFAEITGKETKWATFDSCYIKTETAWMRWDEYKLRHTASEVLK